MSLALRTSAPISGRESLKSKKAHIEEQLGREQTHLSASDIYLKQLKKMKLQLKEEIHTLEVQERKSH